MSSLTATNLPPTADLEAWVRKMLGHFPIPTAAELATNTAGVDPLVALFRSSHGLWACTLLNVLDPSVCCSDDDDDDEEDEEEDGNGNSEAGADDAAVQLARNMRRFAAGVAAIGVAANEAFTSRDLAENNATAVHTTVHVLRTLVSFTSRLSGSDDDGDGRGAAPAAAASDPKRVSVAVARGSAAGRIIRQHQTLSSSLRNSVALGAVADADDALATITDDDEDGASGSGSGSESGEAGAGPSAHSGSVVVTGDLWGESAGGVAMGVDAGMASSVYTKPMTLEERRKARDAEAEVLVEEGFMTKRGGSRRNWQKRHFVLTTKKLTYATNRNKAIKGEIDANDMIAVHDEHDPAEIKKRKHCFCLVTSHRRYYMSCSSEAYKEVWMEALKSVINFTPTNAAPELGGGAGGESASASAGGGRESGRSGTIHILPETQLRAGLLTKKGGSSSSWAKRWFVLTNWKLTYAAKPDKPVKGTIQVANIRSVGVADPETCSKSNALEIVTPTRTFEAFAPSEMERNEWIEDVRSTMLARTQHALLSSERILLRVIVFYACQPMVALLSMALTAPMTSIKHAIFTCLGLDPSLLIHYVLVDDHLVPIEHAAANLAATSLFDGKTLYLRPKPDAFISFFPKDVGGGSGASASGAAGGLAVRQSRQSRSLSAIGDRSSLMAAIGVGVHNAGTSAGIPYAAPDVRLSPLAVAEVCREGRVTAASYSAIAASGEYWASVGEDGKQSIVMGGALDDLTWTSELSTRVVTQAPVGSTTRGERRVITQGYVMKRAGTGPVSARGKAWQRRWLTLTDSCLLYAKGPDGAVKGAIDLERLVTVVAYVDVPADIAEHVFALVSPARTYYFACATEEDMTQWVAAVAAMLSGDADAAAAANPEVLLEGPLRKRGEGEGSSLNSRWCSLTESSMSYATRKGNPARGKISVSHIMRVEVAEDEDELGFNVVTPERTYYFFASNQLDHSKWVSSLLSVATVPPFPADPFSCWLIWRRAYEASDLATFCAYKDAPGTEYIGGYPFSVARQLGIPSLADIVTPPVSQLVSKDVLATLTLNDKRTAIGDECLSGKVHLRKREGGEGWLVASEDWTYVQNFLRSMA